MGLLVPLPRFDQVHGRAVITDVVEPRIEIHGSSMNKLTVKDLNLRNKRVFIRVDYNVPIADGAVSDDTRIRETLPTLRLAMSMALPEGGVLLLENVRFHPEEEKNDPNFSKQLAALCDGIFVCDAFGSAHRAHASVVGITQYVKQAAAGLLMEKELAYLGNAITNPTRPFVAILGGAKVSDKIEVVENLMKIADAMLIGGGMAYT